MSFISGNDATLTESNDSVADAALTPAGPMPSLSHLSSALQTSSYLPISEAKHQKSELRLQARNTRTFASVTSDQRPTSTSDTLIRSPARERDSEKYRSASPSSSDSSAEVVLFTGRGRSQHPSNAPVILQQTQHIKICALDSQPMPPLATRALDNAFIYAKTPAAAANDFTRETSTWDDPVDNWVHRKDRSIAQGMAARPDENNMRGMAIPRNRKKKMRQNNEGQKDDIAREICIADYISNMRESGAINETLMTHYNAKMDQTEWTTSETGDFDGLTTLDGGRGAVELLLSKRERLKEEPVAEYDGQNEESADGDDLSGGSDDSFDSEDEDVEDERDLVERRIARMTDEKIARLLAKQEELGMGSDELMLFNDEVDDEEADFIPLSTRSRREAARHFRSSVKRFACNPGGDMLNTEDYGDFDIMDHDRLNLVKPKKDRAEPVVFGLSDSELENTLRSTFAADRRKKKAKKQEREELRVQGLLGKKNNNKPNLAAKHKNGMSIDQIREELKDFLLNDHNRYVLPKQRKRGFNINGSKPNSCAFQPMDKKDRKIVHELAAAFNLKSKSAGNGHSRFPVLYKTARSKSFDAAVFAQAQARITKRFFPRMDQRAKNKGLVARNRGGGSRLNGPGISYGDGDVVAAAAPELGAENRGRAMLEKMGWNAGMALGALNNKGILQPVVHVVKTSRAGLG